MRRSIIGSLATASISLVLAVSPVAAENAHFVPSAMTGVYVANAGTESVDVDLGWKVAGLGNGAVGTGSSGRIWVRGWVRTTATCETKRGTQSTVRVWTKRAVDHAIFRDEFGNAEGHDALRGPIPCPNGQVIVGTPEIVWACLDSKLTADVKPYKVWDIYGYQNYDRWADCEKNPPS